MYGGIVKRWDGRAEGSGHSKQGAADFARVRMVCRTLKSCVSSLDDRKICLVLCLTTVFRARLVCLVSVGMLVLKPMPMQILAEFDGGGRDVSGVGEPARGKR